MIFEILKEGKKDAVSVVFIMTATGLESARAVRAQIAKERREGFLIACNMGAPGGYFIPADRQELSEYVALMEKRAKGTLATLRRARIALRNLDGQEQLDAFLEVAGDGTADDNTL